jgi:hypothetical protein
VTDWVFDAFAGAGLRQIMLVHDVGNPASCRVAEKAGYPFLEFSPARTVIVGTAMSLGSACPAAAAIIVTSGR